MKKIYLDHNATTPTHPEVVKAMLPYYEEVFGNASSIHKFGQEAKKAIDEAREKVAEFISAKPEEIVFTSGGTEANNFAIKGVAYSNQERGKHIITSSVEHHAVLNPCGYLEKKGFKVTYLPVDKYGLVDPEDVKKAITKETILVTIMHANNEVGTIQPIAEIGKIIKEASTNNKQKIYFHTDAIQSVSKIPINVDELNVDLLSLSGHKIYGPKGIGALYIRKGTKIEPLIHGGHHERNRRAGTENVPAIVGLGKAIEIVKEDMEKEAIYLTNLREKLYQGIINKVDNVYLNGHPSKRLPNTLNLCFEFVEGESIILNLDMKGVAVSSGSACTSGSLEPSHVLSAMGVPPALAQGSIRFSLGRFTTEEDIDYVVEVLPQIISRLRAMSPLYKKRKE
ncbi:MAG: cysteine desulfurase NifS [Candidatus Omnitrophica bacterium]|nr:cysteine desulfurase NifS [Candidatus Omnitrophota bacterium]